MLNITFLSNFYKDPIINILQLTGHAMNNEAITDYSAVTRKKINEILSKDEIRALTSRSDWAGFWAIVSTWSVITGSFTLAAWSLEQAVWLTAIVLLLCVIVIGGRQLALAIATHEATHRTLFATRALNDHFTDWLCARPVGLDLFKYREHHFIHHLKTGTDDDVDISLIAGLPTTRQSLARKLLRDAVGITGMKFMFGQFVMCAEYMKWTVASNYEWLPKQSRWFHTKRFVINFFPTLITNLAIAAALMMFGYGELYALWLIAYLTTYPMFIRIRALAEHAATQRTNNMFENTRTTRAGWLAKSLVAPLNVNYHIEHHALASVPWYKLPRLHKLFLQRGVVQPAPSYLEVLRIVSSKNPISTSNA